MTQLSATSPEATDRTVTAGPVDLHDPTLLDACAVAAELAAVLLAAPAAVVTLARDGGEVVEAAAGLGEPWVPLRRLAPDVAFCTAVVATASPLAVDDTAGTAHEALAASGVRAFLAVPLAPGGGPAVGALAVVTPEPRRWTEGDAARLTAFARLLTAEIERRTVEREARAHTTVLMRTTEALLAQIAQREDAEATLRESEARWRTLIEHAPEAILVHDASSWRIVQANANAVRLFEMPRERLLEASMDALSAPAAPDAPPVATRLASLAQRTLAGEIPVVEWAMRTGSGRIVPCEVRLVRLPGARTRLRSSITDISERKRAEDAVRASEAALAEAQRIARMGSWEVDLETGAVRYSRGLRQLLGVDEDDGDVSARFRAAIHPDDLPTVERTVVRAIRRLRPYTLDHRVVSADGGERVVHQQGDVVRDESGRAVRFVATVVDVTERTRAERERAELLARERAARRDAEAARERLALLADASVRLTASLEVDATLATIAGLAVPTHARWSAVWLLDPEGGARRVDAGSVPAAGPVGAQVESLVAEALHGAAARMVGGPDGGILVVPLRVRDRVIGALAWVDGRASAYDDDDRALAEEIAGRAALALEAARLYEEAQSANRLKDEFLATLSHELRTPLSAVLGWASLIRSEDLPPEEIGEALEAIERNARAQTRLVEDVLEVSRIVTGKIRMARRPVELGPTVHAAVEALRPTAQEKGLALAVDVPATPTLVLGDPDRLQQIWWNLLSNAIKFTPAGGTVSVALRGAHGLVEVEVADDGEGIDAETLPHVFERFRQGDSSSTRRHGGLGLGLALVRHFTELLGGTVEARSAGRGHGTTMTVRLPPLGLQTALPLLPPRDRADGRARRQLAGLRVLLVEDDDDVRAMMRAVLVWRGATVSEAADVAGAMAVVERDAPDVVLSDLQMPGEDGYALLRRLRERERAGARPIPAAAVTAHAGAEHRARALSAGFEAQIAKPVDAETLVGLVDALARGAAAHGG